MLPMDSATICSRSSLVVSFIRIESIMSHLDLVFHHFVFQLYPRALIHMKRVLQQLHYPQLVPCIHQRIVHFLVLFPRPSDISSHLPP